MARLVRSGLLLATTALAGLALSGCGVGQAVSDARGACVFVHKAVVIEKSSQAAGLSAVRVQTLQANAMAELLKASPLAARATSSDGSWNPLMTTINESERVPFVDVEPALTRLCQVADSSSPYEGA